MRFRAWLTQHLGALATAEPAARAEDWLRGRADLLIAGMSGQVPAVVQLDVLAHADLGRLADLGRNSRLGSAAYADGAMTSGIREAKRLLGRPSVHLGAILMPPAGETCWSHRAKASWHKAQLRPVSHMPRSAGAWLMMAAG